ncbi:MAG TPA: hypothetical protein VNA25_29015 [Phycisphaerae bacterium]|nr:hypothetical protein [Phycisphaerae bacterium]
MIFSGFAPRFLTCATTKRYFERSHFPVGDGSSTPAQPCCPPFMSILIAGPVLSLIRVIAAFFDAALPKSNFNRLASSA